MLLYIKRSLLFWMFPFLLFRLLHEWILVLHRAAMLMKFSYTGSAQSPKVNHRVFKSSHRRCSIKKAYIKNLEIFAGKHLCWSLFLRKLQAWRPATLLKRDSKETLMNIAIFLRKPILKKICERLLMCVLTLNFSNIS